MQCRDTLRRDEEYPDKDQAGHVISRHSLHCIPLSIQQDLLHFPRYIPPRLHTSSLTAGCMPPRSYPDALRDSPWALAEHAFAGHTCNLQRACPSSIEEKFSVEQIAGMSQKKAFCALPHCIPHYIIATYLHTHSGPATPPFLAATCLAQNSCRFQAGAAEAYPGNEQVCCIPLRR